LVNHRFPGMYGFLDPACLVSYRILDVHAPSNCLLAHP
jgi:hypothetical protein